MNAKKLLAGLLSLAFSVNFLSVSVSADWETKDGKTYYTDENGDYVTGWQTIDDSRYYFSSKGVMKTGWVKMKSGKTYYFMKDGKMKTGWLKSGDKKYYFDKKGVMATGDVKIGKKIYYFFEDGTLGFQYKNCVVYVGNKLYSLDTNGNFDKNVIISVKSSDGTTNKYYIGKNGYAITIKKTIDGKIYEFDAEKGLISVNYPRIKVGSFKNNYIKLSNFKAENNDTYSNNSKKITYSGSITNKYSKTVNFYIYASFYDKKGNLLKNSQIISCSNVKPGETYKFDDYTYVDDVVDKIEFTDIDVYLS